MNLDELRRAVDIGTKMMPWISLMGSEEQRDSLNTLLSLASAYLAVEGVPDKKPVEGDKIFRPESDENYGFNEALSLCRAVIVKKEAEIQELKSTLNDMVLAGYVPKIHP